MNKYLASMTFTTISVVLICGLANYVIDPFVIYGYDKANEKTLGRIEQFPNMRLYKPLHVNWIKPDVLVIGSSRTGGLKPARDEWPDYSSYNFSTPGMTLYEIKRSVEHAHSVNPLKKLTIGLDYSAFILPEPDYRLGFEEDRLARTAPDLHSIRYRRQQMADFQSTLFTLSALGKSMEAVSKQSPHIRQYFLDGSWRGLTNKLTGRGGYIYVAKTSLPAQQETSFDARGNLQVLRELLEFCYREKIETKLFFTPTHVFFVDWWQTHASKKLWRQVHRSIITTNSELAKEYDRKSFDIWGFGHIDGVTNEPIYNPKDTPQAWFNDGVHFRPKMSKKIMSSLWDKQSPFGRRLSTGTIDQYLQDVDTLKDKFLLANRKLIDSMYKKIGQ